MKRWGRNLAPTLAVLLAAASGRAAAGNYFGTAEPSLADTIRSLTDTTLVYPTLQKITYSNAGIATVGYVLEVTQKQPFAPYLEEAVLVPLGMAHSSFEKKPELMK